MATITINDFKFISYATVEDADKYFSAKFGSTWANIQSEEKAKLLASKAKMLSEIARCEGMLSNLYICHIYLTQHTKEE